MVNSEHVTIFRIDPCKSDMTRRWLNMVRQNLVAFEGQAKPSKIKSVMKWWSKCISVEIAKTATKNVAFKAAKIADSALAGQSEILTREVARDNVPTDEEALDDLGRDATRI